jgi:hypothetical protein
MTLPGKKVNGVLLTPFLYNLEFDPLATRAI